MSTSRAPSRSRPFVLTALVLALLAWQVVFAAPVHGAATPAALLTVLILAQLTGATGMRRRRLAHAVQRS